MKAYLEKINKEWLDDFVYISKYPLESMGYEIIPFNGEVIEQSLSKYAFNNNDILIGSVEATKFFLEKLNVKCPNYIGYPPELSDFYKRKIEIKKVKDLDYNFPYFIKPATDVKLFTGDIIENKSLLRTFQTFYGVDEETLLYVSEVINIQSEYRCFVHNGILRGIQYYLGDFKKYPNYTVIEDIISKYKNQPIAYTIDIGVTDKNETIIVEINDMWAIGAYGFNKDLYTKMCVDRMREIINNK